ncbi:MAG: preprotein translocase subunit SecG [Cytophagales bacterium]|nr:preprotein translocase subunit SecG [Bernardetiaceae bacterium]MDW8211091.1 preprotein translocase subunit SecG [Cytophagales bacterium]
MTQLIIILIIIVSILLMLAVLAQNPKGSGLAGGGASVATQIMGAKRTTDFLEQVTWTFAIAIMSLALLANITLDRSKDISSPNIEAAKSKEIKTIPPSTDSTEQVKDSTAQVAPSQPAAPADSTNATDSAGKGKK